MSGELVSIALNNSLDDGADPVLSIPVGSFVVFYRVSEDRVWVVRVLHSALDAPTTFQRDLDETYESEDGPSD